MAQIGIKVPTEDKEDGPAITTIQEVEIAAEVTVEATGEVMATNQKGMHKGGTSSPHNLRNHNNHSNRIDNHRMEVDMEVRGAEEGKKDPEGNVNSTTTVSRTEDTEVTSSRRTLKETPPRPRLVKNQTTVQLPADQKEQKPKQ